MALTFRAFPVSLDVDGAFLAPCLFIASEAGSEAWVLSGGSPARVAQWGPVTARGRAHGEMMSDGRSKVQWVAETDDGPIALGKFLGGCGCSNPLRSFVPPKQEVPA